MAVAVPASKQAEYLRIAKSKIKDPGAGTRRWLIYGRKKQGKTTFLSSIPHRADGGPNMLVLDFEQGHGTKEIPEGDIKVWPIFKWEDTQEAMKAVQTGKLPYEWVALDNMGRAANMALRFVMRTSEERDLDRIPGQVQKRDYGKSGELLKGMLYNFHTLPINVIYTAPERVETGNWNDGDEDDDVDTAAAKFVPDLPKGARGALNDIVDVIGRIYVVRIKGKNRKTGKEVTVVRRRLWINPSDVYDTGYRSKHKLPDYLASPTIPRLEQLISTGKVE